MSVLIVIAHPDDEVLGCGATAALLARTGVPVTTCVLSGDVAARRGRPEVEALQADARTASASLGMQPPIFGPFPNIAFNTVPHLELVQFIEHAIEQTGATTLFTHHPADLNDDHLHTSRACQAAARLAQRRSGLPALDALYFMEISSSSDWAFPGTYPPFAADTYVPVPEDIMALKVRALECYAGVMRPSPHPRREEVLRALAAIRGAEAGVAMAEAFQTAFRRWEPGT